MPVSLNEPISGLQRICEAVTINEEIFSRAATTEDSLKRMTIAFIAFNSAYSMAKLRKKKPFNPMLGETYELVTDKVQFISEKVEHSPCQINVWQLKGKDFIAHGYNASTMKLKAVKGMIEITQLGPTDVYFKKFDETISISKPNI